MEVRAERQRLELTQQEAASRWGMSQTYLSLVEGDKRPVPARLVRLLARKQRRFATALPFADQGKAEELPEMLGAAGYPGFAHVAKPRHLSNPAGVVFAALNSSDVPARVTEALPWVLVTFPDLDWTVLVDKAKSANRQNRLGYLVHLAKELAVRKGSPAASKLEVVEQELEDARLAKEDTLGRKLTEAERTYFRAHRSEAAAHWNLLTSLQVDDLRYGA
jgi:transcriptional regulator with XRE-family HTH domain